MPLNSQMTPLPPRAQAWLPKLVALFSEPEKIDEDQISDKNR